MGKLFVCVFLQNPIGSVEVIGFIFFKTNCSKDLFFVKNLVRLQVHLNKVILFS